MGAMATMKNGVAGPEKPADAMVFFRIVEWI
jgi:hypothetical protein